MISRFNPGEEILMNGIAQCANKIFKKVVARYSLPKIDFRCPVERLGSSYGGWDIATGDVGPSSIVYSIGIGEDASFDMALIEKYAVNIHAFDPTPKSISWVKSQNFPNSFIFQGIGVADFDGNTSFNPPDNPDHVSGTILDRKAASSSSIEVVVKRLITIMNELGHKRIDILKMDIEGAEYRVIEDIVKSGVRPKQILVEFHHQFPDISINDTRDAIKRLKSIGYSLFSVSDTCHEFSFIHSPARPSVR